MPGARASALSGIAQALCADERLFDPRRDLADAVGRLRDLAGVGEWTAQYIAMRALGESDAFLAADVRCNENSVAGNGRRPRRCWHMRSGGDRGARMPRCTYGWRTHTFRASFHTRRRTMHLRLEQYSAPISQLLLVTDESGALRA